MTTLLALVLSLALQAVEPSPQDTTPEATQQEGQASTSQASTNQDDPTPVPAVEQIVSPPNEEQCNEYPQSTDYSDLCEQWRMANAAEKAVDLGFWQNLLTLGEVVGLILVVSLTYVAIGQTRKVLARDRAWVVISAVTLRINPDGDIGPVFVWRNTGRSPAMDVRVYTEIAVVDHGGSARFEGEDRGDLLGTLGPEIEQHCVAELFAAGDIRRAQAGKVHLVAHSTVIYGDVRGALPHRTEATFEFIIPRDATDAQLRNKSILDSIPRVGWPTQNTAT